MSTAAAAPAGAAPFGPLALSVSAALSASFLFAAAALSAAAAGRVAPQAHAPTHSPVDSVKNKHVTEHHSYDI